NNVFTVIGKIIQGTYIELANKLNYEKALNNIKINEENLKEIGLKFKSNLSIDLKAILALIDSNDLDEFVNLMKNKSFVIII
ncbi:hypothetical protein Mgra_00004235, partial [Meloidogyne graminicola]